MATPMLEGEDRAHLDRAVAQMRAGQFTAARAVLEILADRYPDAIDVALVLGSALLRMNDPLTALPQFQRVRVQAPSLGLAALNEGLCLRALDRLPEATAAFAAARAARPGDGLAAYHAIKTLVEMDNLEDAIAVHADASASLVDPEYLPSLASALLPEVPRSLADMQRMRDAYERAIESLGVPRGTVDEHKLLATAGAFFAAYQGVSNRRTQQLIADYYAALCPSLTSPVARAAKPEGRIRIGFVSTHFYNHTIGKLTRGLIAGLDREKFEVFVFSTRSAEDEIGRYIAGRCDRFSVLPRDLAAARTMLADAAPDVLFYPDIGMEPLTYFLAFARLAPVQCVTWGHPVTTGIPAVDYFISSMDLESPDPAVAEAEYSEELVRLSVPPTYLHPVQESSREAAPDLSFARDATRYVCVQQAMKFHPDFDRILIEILRRDPTGVLILLDLVPALTARLRARLSHLGPDVASRIHFLPRLGQAGFLELLKAAHVVFDTTHFSGGITSAEALGLGKIVVTLPHPVLMAGRVTYAYYRQMDLDAAVARDANDYIAKAVRFGHGRFVPRKRRTADRGTARPVVRTGHRRGRSGIVFRGRAGSGACRYGFTLREPLRFLRAVLPYSERGPESGAPSIESRSDRSTSQSRMPSLAPSAQLRRPAPRLQREGRRA